MVIVPFLSAPNYQFCLIVPSINEYFQDIKQRGVKNVYTYILHTPYSIAFRCCFFSVQARVSKLRVTLSRERIGLLFHVLKRALLNGDASRVLNQNFVVATEI